MRPPAGDRHCPSGDDPETRDVVGVHAQPLLEVELAESLDDGREVDAAVAEG